MRRELLLRGYALLQVEPLYRGIGRRRFEPVLPVDLSDSQPWCYPPGVPKGRIWPFWPEGSWQRDAFQLYEDNLAPHDLMDIDLLSSLPVARRLLRFVEQFEIVLCECWEPGTEMSPASNPLLGFDAGGKGGDCGSLVRELVWGTGETRLLEAYRGQLNENGLLPGQTEAENLIRDVYTPPMLGLWRLMEP